MKKINFIDSIRQPIITEKATILSEQNKTVFKVHSGANKTSIKKNIEKIFKVTVLKVNIIIQKRKKKIKQGKISTKTKNIFTNNSKNDTSISKSTLYIIDSILLDYPIP